MIVKADSTGAINNCTYATVLEKEAQAAGFIKIYDDAGDELEVFGGTYMKINAWTTDLSFGGNRSAR